MAGVDEAGRGPLAGPVVAAAIIFQDPSHCLKILGGLNDSKQVPPAKRKALFPQILRSTRVSIGIVHEAEVDFLNIYQASRLAMKKAVLSLPCTPDLLLIDGKMKLDLPIRQQAIVGGDAKSACIAAASIIAKVWRDAWMEEMHERYPLYGFDRHKGYGTKEHRQNLRLHGPSPIHRRTFLSRCLSEELPR